MLYSTNFITQESLYWEPFMAGQKTRLVAKIHSRCSSSRSPQRIWLQRSIEYVLLEVYSGYRLQRSIEDVLLEVHSGSSYKDPLKVFF